MNNKNNAFGVNDNSYQAAGGLEGLTKLVKAFYNNMSTLSESKKIRDMHPTDLTESEQKLAYFLSGWLGGPKLYKEHYGGINIPQAHKHIPIGGEESEAWLMCMQKAVDVQHYDEAFKVYLMQQLRIPAQRIQAASESHFSNM